MSLYQGPLSSSPLVKKKERLTKVGHEWEDEEGGSPHAPNTDFMTENVQQQLPVQQYFAPPVLTPMVMSPGANGSPQYHAMPQDPYAPWPPGVPAGLPGMWPVPNPNPVPPAGSLSPPLAPTAGPAPDQPAMHSVKQTRVVSAPPTPGMSPNPPSAKFGRRRPQSTGDQVDEDAFFWRLGMGEGEAERKAAQHNARDRYKRDLERQIEERQRLNDAERRQRQAEDSQFERQIAAQPTAPGERTGRSDHSYARIRGQMFTDNEIERQKEKEQQARQLQHDLELQIQERRRAKEAEEQQRKESDAKWNAKYGGGGSSLRRDKEAMERDRVKENIAIQEEAANALRDPRFAPLKKVYHHQRNPPSEQPQPAPPPLPPPQEAQRTSPTPPMPPQNVTPPDVVSPVAALPSVEKRKTGFKLSPQLKSVEVEGAGLVGVADFGLKSFIKFKPPPVSYPDQRMVEQERRLAALESMVTAQQRQLGGGRQAALLEDLSRLTDRNKSRLTQLNDISRKIEVGDDGRATEEILKEFVSEADQVDKMFGWQAPDPDIEEPIWLRENNVEQHEAFSGATLPGKSEWVERELEEAKLPDWLQEEKQEKMAATIMSARTDAISIPATHDVDDNFVKNNFPVGSRVHYKGQVGVIYRHTENNITIYLDSTGEVLETQAHDLRVIEFPPIKTTTYSPQTSAHSDPTPEPSIPVPSSQPPPLDAEGA